MGQSHLQVTWLCLGGSTTVVQTAIMAVKASTISSTVVSTLSPLLDLTTNLLQVSLVGSLATAITIPNAVSWPAMTVLHHGITFPHSCTAITAATNHCLASNLMTYQTTSASSHCIAASSRNQYHYQCTV